VCTDAMIVERSQLYENDTNRYSSTVQYSTVYCGVIYYNTMQYSGVQSTVLFINLF
jgi:hypothetical protein